MLVRVIRAAAWSGALLVAGAFTPWPATSAPKPHVPSPPAHPAMPVATSELPAYATKTPQLAALYRWAAAHRKELQFIPCTCGCDALGHRSNWNCFAKAEPSPGKYVWDDHGVECLTCQGIALDVQRGLARGQTLVQIRRAIDAKWGASTMKTPLPMGSF